MGALDDAVRYGMETDRLRQEQTSSSKQIAAEKISELAREFAEIASRKRFDTESAFKVPGQSECWSIYLAEGQDFYSQEYLIVFPGGEWTWAEKYRKNRLFGGDLVGWTRRPSGPAADHDPAYFVEQFKNAVIRRLP